MLSLSHLVSISSSDPVCIIMHICFNLNFEFRATCAAKSECAIMSSIMWCHLVKNTGGMPQRELSSALSNMASFSTSTFYSRRPRLSDKEAERVLEAIASNDTSDLELSDDEVDDPSFAVGDAAPLPQRSDGQ